MKTIEERKKQFKIDLWEAIGQNFNTYTKEMLTEFTEYWCEKSVRGTKMRFEKEKTFDPKRRIATWKRNAMIFNPEKEEKMPSYFQKTYWQRVTGEKLLQYKEYLTSIGYKYVTSPGGTFWQKPDGQRIWL